MADLGCTSPQGQGKAGMAVVDTCCPGTSSAGRIVDCPDTEGTVVEIVDIGRAWVDIAGVADTVRVAGLVMTPD